MIRPSTGPAAVRAVLLALLLATLGACVSPPPGQDRSDALVPPPTPSALGTVLARTERQLIYLPREGDTLGGLAERFLGATDKAWQIAEVNGDLARPEPGVALVVPLVMPNPLGVTADGARSVTVLCYHRVGTEVSKMSVSPSRFEAQLDWLLANGYRVIRLSELAEFLAGKRAVPRRAVVLTFDDGYQNVYRNAFPLLKKKGVAATVFIYTDFVGAGDGLSWAQMNEMQRSGLVDIQSHTKSHANLAQRLAGETDAAYRQRLDRELKTPMTLAEREMAETNHRFRYLAYPYGDANDFVLDAMRRNDYTLGLTVTPGSNAFYAAPMMLRRVMIFGDNDLGDFEARLLGRRGAGKP